MKHLITCIALGIACAAGAQSNNPQGWSNYDFPWNPDADNNNAIGSEDLLQLLSVYGNEYGYNPPSCDYEGTSLENLWSDLVTGVAIMDSMFYEIELEDIDLTYYPGCPDQVYDTLNIVVSDVITDWHHVVTNDSWRVTGLRDDCVAIVFYWYPDESDYPGEYQFYHRFCEFGDYAGLGWLDNAQSSNAYSGHESLPLPITWYMDEAGIHFEGVEWCNQPNEYCPVTNFVQYVTNLTLIPYWHYAE